MHSSSLTRGGRISASRIMVMLLSAALVASLFVVLFADTADARHRHHHHRHKGSSTVSVSPSTLNFGDVTVGTPKSLDVTIKNNGTKPITIPVDALSGDGFTIDPSVTLPKTIASGDSVKVPVIFNPTTPGLSKGSLKIRNSADKTVKSVLLKGTGVLP